jgi:hypothetical protein
MAVLKRPLSTRVRAADQPTLKSRMSAPFFDELMTLFRQRGIVFGQHGISFDTVPVRAVSRQRGCFCFSPQDDARAVEVLSKCAKRTHWDAEHARAV